MASINESKGMGVTDDNDADDEQNLWASILSEVQSSSASKLSSSKSLLFVGNNYSGKTTLVAKLQENEDPKKGAGLEYYYLNVKDEYRDDQTRLSCWVLDGDVQQKSLQRFSLTEENFADTLVILVASMAQPWSIMESLERWVSVLREHINRLKISQEEMREYEQSMVRFFQEYTEPEEGQTAPQTVPRRDVNPLHPTASKSEEDETLLPLGENTLTHNLGIPIIVVITKTDAISSLEKEHDYKEEHFDFIQQHIRKFCLRYGAALCYNSVKEDKNCDLLYRYIVHRIYGFPFTSQAYVVEKDSVFVPAGWDNNKKISILYENMTTMKPDDKFEDFCVKPVTRKIVHREAEIAAEDEQVFLMKLQSTLSKQPAPGQQGGESPVRPPPGANRQQAQARPQGTPGPPLMASTPRKPGDPKGAAASEGMLANFFNSLLNKKSGAPPTKADKTAVTRDAAAELERMNRAKKSVSDSNMTNNTGES